MTSKRVSKGVSVLFLLLGLQWAPFSLRSGPSEDPRFTVRTIAPLEFNLTHGDEPVRSRGIVLKNAGELSLDWVASSTEPWLRIEPASGSLPRHGEVEIAVIANAEGFSPGIYHAKIQIASPSAGPHPLAATMIEQSAFTGV